MALDAVLSGPKYRALSQIASLSSVLRDYTVVREANTIFSKDRVLRRILQSQCHFVSLEQLYARLPSGLYEIIGNLELETHIQLPTGIIEHQLQLKFITLIAQFCGWY